MRREYFVNQHAQHPHQQRDDEWHSQLRKNRKYIEGMQPKQEW